MNPNEMSESELRIKVAGWLGEQLTRAEAALKAREQAEAVLSGGTDESWSKAALLHPLTAGKPFTKAERIQAAEREGRIAIKCRHDLHMLKTLSAFVATMQPVSEEKNYG